MFINFIVFMFIHFIICAFLLFNLTSCKNSSSSSNAFNWQTISNRDTQIIKERSFIYHAQVPEGWIRKDPESSLSIADTTLANGEFNICENDEILRITVHTFPVSSFSLRISPQMQIDRWKKQLDSLDPLSMQVLPISHGGFTGLYFEGQGSFKGQSTKIMGWSMQLASCYEKQLISSKNPIDRDKCADYTIKAIGPSLLINQHQAAIHLFADSFELIEELPAPL